MLLEPVDRPLHLGREVEPGPGDAVFEEPGAVHGGTPTDAATVPVFLQVVDFDRPEYEVVEASATPIP